MDQSANSVTVLLSGLATRYSCRIVGPLMTAAVSPSLSTVNDGDDSGAVR